MFKNLNLEKTYHILLLFLAFLLPLTVFGANLVIAAIVVLWLLTGNYKYKFHQFINNNLLVASIIFFFVHVVGLLWTEDVGWGMEIVRKMWYFIGLFPILFTLIKKESKEIYVSAFLLAIFITEILSFLIWFELISPFGKATLYNPIPFMSHTSYNPILALAIYIVGHKILFLNPITKSLKVSYVIFFMMMVVNMFITGGRMGQLMFFLVILILTFQFFNYQFIKSLLVSIFSISLIFFTAYNLSPIFKDRINEGVRDINTYDSYKSSSVGIRMTFASNSWEIIRKNPIFGVGTGDFPREYEKVNKKNTPEVELRNPGTTNPHNMYILVLVQSGLLGLISLLAIFFCQIKKSFQLKDKFQKDLGLALPLLFLAIMFGESYLLGHYTSLLFVFFSALIYKSFEEF